MHILPLKFNPKGSSGGIIYFTSREKGDVGHFSDSPYSAKSNSSRKNSCLINAVSQITGRKVDRNYQVANIVRNDEKIRDGIIRGLHTHFIERGGTGEKELKRLTRLIDDIKNQPGKTTREKKRQLTDLQEKAGMIIGKVYKTGIMSCFHENRLINGRSSVYWMSICI